MKLQGLRRRDAARHGRRRGRRTGWREGRRLPLPPPGGIACAPGGSPRCRRGRDRAPSGERADRAHAGAGAHDARRAETAGEQRRADGAPAPSCGPPATRPLAMPGPKMPRPSSDKRGERSASAS